MNGAELFALAKGAGFSGAQARIMAAIALGESGGNPAAIGDEQLVNGTWGPSIGLWQIRSLHAHRGTGKERDATRLTDPRANAAAARIIYGQQGYRAWTVYNTGAYGKHLRAVDAALDGKAGLPGQPNYVPAGGLLKPGNVVDAVGGGVVDAGKGVLSGLDAVGGFFGALGSQSTWVRVLQVVGGAGLVAGGLVLLGKDVAGPIASAAADVIPQARAVKVAGAAAKAAT